LPIISQTANALSEDRGKSISAGCIDYISKPITEKTLMKKPYKHLIIP